MKMYDFIGDNAPNYRIELSGANEIKDTIVEKQYNTTHNTATPLKFKDEYIVPSINSKGELQIDVFKTNKFLYGDFEPDDIVIYDSFFSPNMQFIPISQQYLYGHNNSITATVLDSGELQIYLSIELGNISCGYVISGFDYNDLKYKSTIVEKQVIKSNVIQHFGITEPFKTNSGYIIIGVDQQFPHPSDNSLTFRRMEVYISKDKGNSWSHIYNIGTGRSFNLIYKTSGFFRFKDKGYLSVYWSSGTINVFEIDANGENLTTIVDRGNRYEYSPLFTFETLDNTYINILGNGNITNFQIYASNEAKKIQSLLSYKNNNLISNIKLLGTSGTIKSTIIDGKILIVTYLKNETYFTVIEPLKTAINQDVIDISIDRPKNMIGSATIKLNNYMAKYSPDGETNPYKLFPNKEVIIYLGYGKDLKKAFTGYIDSVQMNSYPHIITIQCRDTLKLCKDQLLYYNNKYTHKFKNRTPENLFRILCNAAGVKYGTVEKTGIRLAEVEWNYISVYDCMEEIAELSGFELSCDENGVLHFVEEKPKENQPIVKEFKEGKNITTLDYSIDDNELYHSVIAQGKKEKEITVKNKKGKKVKKKVEEIISYRDYWEPRNFYNLPENKILVVDASEADNKTELKKIVDQALYLMTCRARQVSFEAIADTSLKVGDMIKVEESGSTISEIYRITGIGFDLNNSGYTMSIECYHHRNVKPEENESEED